MGKVTKSVARGEDLELVLGGKGGPQWAGDVDMETPVGRARRDKDNLSKNGVGRRLFSWWGRGGPLWDTLFWNHHHRGESEHSWLFYFGTRGSVTDGLRETLAACPQHKCSSSAFDLPSSYL